MKQIWKWVNSEIGTFGYSLVIAVIVVTILILTITK